MTDNPTTCCLKIDVDTHDGMRDGVPRLLDALREYGMRASFFLAFGPDNSGKAIWQVFRSKGFLRKMLKTGAPKLYGWRTMVSGTLLPSRLIAVKFPDIVRRIAAEGHEVAVHSWDHRRWQDHIDRFRRCEIEDQFTRAFDAYERILGERPRAVGAPGWRATQTSLQVQDGLRLLYASDMRSGPPGYPDFDGYRADTLQIPTTQPCLEELLTLGLSDLTECARRVLERQPGVTAPVIPLHAEVEGGAYEPFLTMLLDRIRETGAAVSTLREHAERLLARPGGAPRIRVGDVPAPGRAGVVLGPVADDLASTQTRAGEGTVFDKAH